MKQKNWWRYIVMIPILFVYLTPFYILLGTAFKAPNDYSSRWVMPGYLYLDNFATALSGRTSIFDSRIFMGIRDSVIVTVITVVLIIFIGSLAAYPLARKPSRLNKAVRSFIVGVMMVPPLSILVPMYRVMIAFNAISTYHSVILLLLTFQLPLAIFIYSRFIASIPVALDEAAAIDGCGPLRTFFSIILPQMKPVTVSVAILTGVTCWNDYQFSLYMLQSPRITSVTLAVSGFFAQVSSNPHAAAAAAALGVLPIVIIFLVLQKYFIQGMVDSAVK